MKLCQRIVAYIRPVDEHFAAGRVVKTRNKLQQRTLAGTGRSRHSHRHARRNAERDAVEHVGLAATVPERNVAELDGTAANDCRSARRVLQRRLRTKHLQHTVGRGRRTGDVHDYHGEHHQRHQYLHEVVHQRNELADLQSSGRHPLSPHPEHHNHRKVQHELHHGEYRHDDVGRLHRYVAQIPVACRKLARLVSLAHERFHHPHVYQVLPHDGVHGIHLLLHLQKIGKSLTQNQIYAYPEHGYGSGHYQCKAGIYPHHIEEGHHEHHRRTEQDAQSEQHDLLQARDIARQTRDERSGVEFVHFGEGELLYLAEQSRTQLRSESDGSVGRDEHIRDVGEQPRHRDTEHPDTDAGNDRDVAVHDSLVHNARHQHGLERLADDEDQYEHGAHHDAPLVPAEYVPIRSYHTAAPPDVGALFPAKIANRHRMRTVGSEFPAKIRSHTSPKPRSRHMPPTSSRAPARTTAPGHKDAAARNRNSRCGGTAARTPSGQGDRSERLFMLLLFSAESRLHFAFLFQTLLYGGFLAILYEAFHLFLEIAAATAAFFPVLFLFHNPICFVNFKTVPSADGRRLSGECTKCVQNCRPQRKTSGRREEPQRAATARAIGNRYAAINIYLTNRMPCSRQQAQSLPHLTKTRTHSSKQLLLWKTK